jgi:hypothetical protein
VSVLDGEHNVLKTRLKKKLGKRPKLRVRRERGKEGDEVRVVAGGNAEENARRKVSLKRRLRKL